MMLKIDQYVVKINITVYMRMCGCVCMYDNCVNVRTYLGVSRLNNELICIENGYATSAKCK